MVPMYLRRANESIVNSNLFVVWHVLAGRPLSAISSHVDMSWIFSGYLLLLLYTCHVCLSRIRTLTAI
jgi:hypothetical protein